jgi:hypothetical protein
MASTQDSPTTSSITALISNASTRGSRRHTNSAPLLRRDTASRICGNRIVAGELAGHGTIDAGHKMELGGCQRLIQLVDQTGGQAVEQGDPTHPFQFELLLAIQRLEPLSLGDFFLQTDFHLPRLVKGRRIRPLFNFSRPDARRARRSA